MIRLVIVLATLVLSAGAARAQAEVAAKAADALVQQGLSGVIIVLLGCAIVYLAYALRASWQARLDDSREFAKQFLALSNDYSTATHDTAKTVAAQAVAIDGIAADGRARWLEVKGILDRVDDKFDAMAGRVEANGSSLGRIESDIRDIRNHAAGQRPGGAR